MRLAGVDLSFTRTGLSLLDSEKKEIVCYRSSSTIQEKTLKGVVEAGLVIIEDLKKKMGRVDGIIFEEVFAGGEFSAGLFALDTLFFMAFKGNHMISYLPSALVHFHHKRDYSKSDSVNLALRILGDLQKIGYKNVSDHKWCHDEAESFIYLFAGALNHTKVFGEYKENLKRRYPTLIKSGRRWS